MILYAVDYTGGFCNLTKWYHSERAAIRRAGELSDDAKVYRVVIKLTRRGLLGWLNSCDGVNGFWKGEVIWEKK